MTLFSWYKKQHVKKNTVLNENKFWPVAKITASDPLSQPKQSIKYSSSIHKKIAPHI